MASLNKWKKSNDSIKIRTLQKEQKYNKKIKKLYIFQNHHYIENGMMGINDNLDVRHISAHLAQKALLMISPSMSK